MTCCLGVIALIEIAAARAGIQGISALGTGRCNYCRHVVVTELCDCLGFGAAAALSCTGEGSHAVFKAGSGFGYLAAVKRVTECVGIVIGIAVIALFAGVQGTALFGAGRCDDCFGIIVTCCFYWCGFRLRAGAALSGLDPVLRTGRGCGDAPETPLMTGGVGEVIVIAMVAACADIDGIALLGAGRCDCFADGVCVTERVNVIRNVAVAAVGAFIGCIALCGTGRLGDGLNIVMPKLWNDLCFGLLAYRASPCHLTLAAFGGGYGGYPHSPPMTLRCGIGIFIAVLAA